MRAVPTALDTSVIVPAMFSWHAHHGVCLPVLQDALAGTVVLPLPVVVESYAVMTRLPQPWRLRPADAYQLLWRTFGEIADVPSLQAEDAWALLEGLSARGTAGGATYDAHIVAVAKKAGVHRLATMNHKHFVRFDLGTILLVVPGAS